MYYFMKEYNKRFTDKLQKIVKFLRKKISNKLKTEKNVGKNVSKLSFGKKTKNIWRHDFCFINIIIHIYKYNSMSTVSHINNLIHKNEYVRHYADEVKQY